MTKAAKTSAYLRRLAQQYLFMEEGGVKVYHVLHDRENYPLGCWYCLDPVGIPGAFLEDQLAVSFDVRDLPEEIRQGPMEFSLSIEQLTGSNWRAEMARNEQRERDLHRAALRRAIAAGFDILANQRAVHERKWAEDAARRAAAADDDDLPF